MTYQADMFSNDAPDIRLVTQDNVLVLRHPSINPKGAEAIERKAARLREIADRSVDKKGKVTA